MARASLAKRAQLLNMAIRMLQQKLPSHIVLSALMRQCGLSRRQAYRYLSQAQPYRQPLPVPAAKQVFTVNLPRPLIQQVRVRCRREHRVISHLVAQLLEQWLASRNG
jgi:hypothetical protein